MTDDDVPAALRAIAEDVGDIRAQCQHHSECLDRYGDRLAEIERRIDRWSIPMAVLVAVVVALAVAGLLGIGVADAI